MNGAESLIRTLVDCGVDHCFANPGTSEMHLVQAIDGVETMRPVLCLFEGVCTGAADGFARVAGRPAATLLHLGAGFANGGANLHNARRAGTPLLNLIGDHPAHHVPYDAPLTSDIEGLARPFSAWVRTSRCATRLARDGAEAVQATGTPGPAGSGRIATLVVPADCAWGATDGPATPLAAPEPPRVSDACVDGVAERLNAHAALLLDGAALTARGQALAARIAAATGCRVLGTTFPARVEQGPEQPPLTRLPYFPEQITKALADVRTLVLAGAEAPVAFFSYPGTPSDPVPQGCTITRLAHLHDDAVEALERLAAAVDAPARFEANGNARPEPPVGKLDTRGAAAAIAATLPEHAIIAADSGGGGAASGPCQTAAPHLWLSLTGGSIGQGGPAATGAALAAPDRPVLALLGDGGAMYTNQALWTQARENLNVTTVIYNNRKYNILDYEYRRLGVNEVGARAASLFEIGRPDIDWAGLARSLGVPGERAETGEDFTAALERAYATDGPYLIEALI